MNICVWIYYSMPNYMHLMYRVPGLQARPLTGSAHRSAVPPD